MKRSTDRILTTHVGSLPRAPSLTSLLVKQEAGEAVDDAELHREMATAVRHVVEKQIEAGVDIINDGEQPRVGFQTYVPLRMKGFGGESRRKPPSDMMAHPDMFAVMARRFPSSGRISNAPQAVAELTYEDLSAAKQELDLFDDATKGTNATERFMTAPSPGIISTTMLNAHYDSHEAYVLALAREMRKEYVLIASRGLVLQIDAPDLAMERTMMWQDKSLTEFLDIARMHVAAMNEAIAGIPKEQVRLHCCWGNWEGPHVHDVPLSEILPVLYGANVGALSLEFANPRHQHELVAFKTHPFPADKVLIPGVLDSTTNYVEHPDVVANRICMAAQAVGDRTRVIAGTDCGFGTFAGYEFIAPSIVWAKLRAMADGAAIATKTTGLSAVAEDDDEADNDDPEATSPATIAADRRRAAKSYAELPRINGYAEEFSVFAGETVHIRAARKPSDGWRGWRATYLPPAITGIEIRRAINGAAVATQVPPKRIRLLEQQPANYRDEGAGYTCRVAVDSKDLPVGVYQCVLHSDGGVSKDIFFNVKPRAVTRQDLLCVLPTFTWQAYNRLGGGSFYCSSFGARRTVSTQRPLRARGDNSIAAALPFLAAFEREGIRYSCVDSADLDRGLCPEGTPGVMTLLTHDEYWSRAMRDWMSRFVHEGGSLLVLGGNTCWWQVGTEGNNVTVDKSPGRESQHWIAQSQATFVSSFRFGGYGLQHAKRDAPRAKHLAQLGEADILKLGSLRIEQPGHPVFAGVSAGPDRSFGGSVPVVYREIDGVPITPDGALDDRRYRVPGVTPRILATGSAITQQGVHETGIVVEAEVGRGHVLNMGTFGWSRGLRQGNAEVTRIVLNACRYCSALALERAAKDEAMIATERTDA